MEIWEHKFIEILKNPKWLLDYYKEHGSFKTLSEYIGYSDKNKKSNNLYVEFIGVPNLLPQPWDVVYVAKKSTPNSFLVIWYNKSLLRYYIIGYNVTIYLDNRRFKQSPNVDICGIYDSCSINSKIDLFSYHSYMKKVI